RLLVRRQGAGGSGWKFPSLPLLPSYRSWTNGPSSMSYNQYAQRRGLGRIVVWAWFWTEAWYGLGRTCPSFSFFYKPGLEWASGVDGPRMSSAMGLSLAGSPDHEALKCLYICGEAPKCTRRGSWLMCTVLRLKAQFQKWWATYAFAIPDDVHVKLVESSTDNVPCVDANDPGAKIITFRPFYFSLGFTFPLSKFFKEVFCAMECGPSQCTSNVYRATMCF
ncbi:unnamed protein product, partial [Prunus brigantina]